jgi:protocatechuate 3,4-dioxygenase beta subunit
MKHAFVLAILGLLGLTPATAQHANPPTNTASIEGLVTKEPGSEPLKKVVLQVIAEDQTNGSNYTVTTDSDGSFDIEKVAAGRYRIYVEKTGFVEINSRGRRAEGRFLTVRSGEEIKDLWLQMIPTAVISGRIVDQDGDPMPDAAVFVLRKKPGGKLETAGAEHTNDLGEFRFHGLFPGQYLVVAMPPPDLRDYEREHEKQSKETDQTEMRYLTTYYPGTYDAAQASAIAVRPGDELPVTLTLTPARAYRVRGIVTGIPAGHKAAVELISVASQTILRSNETGDDGRFEVRGVPPGSYVARVSVGAEEQIMTARQSVNVVAADVDGIKLVPVRSFAVFGYLRFDARPRDDASHYTVSLHSVDAPDDSGFFLASDASSRSAAIDPLGRFQWTNVQPGTYSVRIHGGSPDSYLKSVSVGESDGDSGFTISGPADLELLVSPKGARVDGIVSDHDRPVADTTVVFVPEEKFRKAREHFAVSTSDQHGHFTARGLAPGAYTVFAWQDVDDGMYYDANFLKSQESNATAVKVNESSQQTINLKLSSIAEEWR